MYANIVYKSTFLNESGWNFVYLCFEAVGNFLDKFEFDFLI